MEIRLSQCFIAVDDHDCDAAFERIQAPGAEVLQEPIDRPYGVRDCAFRDPAGNVLRFARRRSG
ncbi:VOC family protein [Streptomyces sp. NPDC002399]